MRDDGADLVLTRGLARVLGEPHAGTDGRHRDEPSPFVDGDLVGAVGAVCVVARLRPDCGAPGVSAIHKAPVDGPVAVNALGLLGDQQADREHHGGLDKALYVMDAAEARHWAGVLGPEHGLAAGNMGENMLIEPGAIGGIDDVEIGAILSIGPGSAQGRGSERSIGEAEGPIPPGEPGEDSPRRGILVTVTGVRNPCSTFARGMGRGDWAEVFSERARVGVYLSVLRDGSVSAGDEVRVVSTPGHRVTCHRWFAHHDPRDARAMLASEAFGNLRLADFTRKYVVAAANEQVG
ncbi:MOSC domain-containing protein [Actinomyces gaoshouyii]|uniref:MOSC domain-containing protein n=1 Tax=Actinomyces gaoshouyii TaxID=1960083 RepID=UPI0009BD4951|nr:MOSC domain-containing protein [Actinomyces gaoshouyii]ARD41848.1 sulfurase [Actinomyces gaoshouyii]